MTDKTPMTVAELIAVLQTRNPADVVMIDCDDSYYSGALTADDMKSGTAVLYGPHDGIIPGSLPNKTIKFPGGWAVDGEWSNRIPVVEKRPCLLIKAE